MEPIFEWANKNQGILALLALVISTPTLIIFFYQLARKIWPSKNQKISKRKVEINRTASLRSEIQENTEWNNQQRNFGVFLIRDIERKLPDSEEIHSRFVTPYSTACLIKINNDSIEFTQGAFGIFHIKQIADS